MNQNSTQPGTAEGAGRHTPGDWEIYRNPGGELEVLANRPGSLCPLICTVNQEQDSDGGRIAVCGGDPVANARRIVAAVNAVAGIPTEALEQGAVSRLLSGAESALAVLIATYDSELRRDEVVRGTILLLRAVIANVEGTQP